MKYMIIVLFCIKKTLSELCNINQSCSYCQYCFEVNKDYCSCSFYNFFCFNKTESIYSYNSSFLQEYDKCSLFIFPFLFLIFVIRFSNKRFCLP